MLFMISCSPPGFTKKERALIGGRADAGTMRVLTTDRRADSVQLRKRSRPLKPAGLQSEFYETLKARMLATVRDPAHEGVGIAAPQVGVRRQLIAVERHDREVPEFEFYVNPKIESYGPETAAGREGCLSVPDRSQEVVRPTAIVVSYLDETSGTRIEERVEGFTAVIFQHEIDHLSGTLYIDRPAQ